MKSERVHLDIFQAENADGPFERGDFMAQTVIGGIGDPQDAGGESGIGFDDAGEIGCWKFYGWLGHSVIVTNWPVRPVTFLLVSALLLDAFRTRQFCPPRPNSTARIHTPYRSTKSSTITGGRSR